MLKLTSLAIAAAIVLSGGARVNAARVNAADKKAPAKSAEDRFAKMDKNGDSKLSLEEFIGKKTDDKKEKATKRFGKLDTNSDKSLSLDEFKAGQKKKKE